MSRPSFFLWISFLALFASVGLACGSGSYKIQSITVNPATADAQSYPNGQVPFVATGYYNSAPATVTPLQAKWGAALGSLPQMELLLSIRMVSPNALRAHPAPIPLALG